MPQFYVPRKNIRGTFFTFEKSESRHLSKVLRKKKGDLIQIFDGEGFVSNAKISDVSKPDTVSGEILSVVEQIDKRISLKIFPAIIKGERFEWMLEKVTELGVDSIIPVFTERTVVRLKPDQIHSKLKRWEKVVLSAAKQCGRNELPKVFPPISFRQAIQKICHSHESMPSTLIEGGNPLLSSSMEKNTLNLILWEGESKNFLSDLFKIFQLATPGRFSSETKLPIFPLSAKRIGGSASGGKITGGETPVKQHSNEVSGVSSFRKGEKEGVFIGNSELSTLNSQHSSINLFFGPEGGFSIQEVDEAKKAGVIPVRLGEDILRAETAVIAAVSIILCTPPHKR